jgi:DNA-binding GntR family transcriptional regulator
MLPLFAFTAIRIVTRGAFDLLHDAQTHRPILDAIKARNPEAARNTLLTGLTEWNANTRAHVFRQNDRQAETSSTESRAAGASQAPFAGGLG